MRPLTKALLVGGGALFAGWIGWGIYSSREAESVPYERQGTVDGTEIRRYPQTIRAETTAPNQRTAFRRLFNYISGANRGEESISMTAPVKTQSGESISMTAPVRSETVETAGSDGEGLRMGFYLPAAYTPETAPEPTDEAVTLVTEPPKTVAVDQFSWFAPAWRVERRTEKLLASLAQAGIEPIDEPSLLRYNDPWTPPFMRRNEVVVEVATQE